MNHGCHGSHGCLEDVTDHRSPFTDYWPLATGYCLLPTAYCPLRLIPVFLFISVDDYGDDYG